MTKQDKHNAYKQCLNDIENDVQYYCCHSFIFNDYIFPFVENVKIKFNELYSMKTTDSELFWFNNKQERIDALKKCIELTK